VETEKKRLSIAVFRHVDTAFDHGFAACEDPSSIFVRER